MTRRTIVIALGGNALQENGFPATAEAQLDVARFTAKYIADIIQQGNRVVITHGNGPQVGCKIDSFHADIPNRRSSTATRAASSPTRTTSSCCNQKNPDLHGRKGACPRQHFRGKIFPDPEIRGHLPERVRDPKSAQERPNPLHQVLQRGATA